MRRDRSRRPSIVGGSIKLAVVVVVLLVALPLVGGLTGLLGNPFRT